MAYLKTEQPPYFLRLNIGNSELPCRAVVRPDRYFSRIPFLIFKMLPATAILEINDIIQSHEDTNDCIGIIKIKIKLEKQTLVDHKVLITTSTTEPHFSLGTVSLFGFGVIMKYRLNSFEVSSSALNENQLKRIFKEKYGEDVTSTKYLKHVQCFKCAQWGHIQAECRAVLRSSPYYVPRKDPTKSPMVVLQKNPVQSASFSPSSQTSSKTVAAATAVKKLDFKEIDLEDSFFNDLEEDLLDDDIQLIDSLEKAAISVSTNDNKNPNTSCKVIADRETNSSKVHVAENETKKDEKNDTKKENEKGETLSNNEDAKSLTIVGIQGPPNVKAFFTKAASDSQDAMDCEEK